ncbi:MAG: hypothetical protein JWM95_4491 [Gemmatimonadetes bacterium]|nr:hypothetical protein [Gemmatimonadota bacterium]
MLAQSHVRAFAKALDEGACHVEPRLGDTLVSYLNVGCGQAPTPGWTNYDNSPSVRLIRKPLRLWVLRRLGIVQAEQEDFIAFARKSAIDWADVTRSIPEANQTVDVIYSSHMLEHLDNEQAMRFLAEARRVLIHGGIIRLALPNIRYHVDNYLQDGDADRFIRAILLTHPRNKTLIEKLKYLWIGERHHAWMYDGASLCKLLTAAGFHDARELESGATSIKDPGALNLRERSPESVFVEAVNP